jgi:hypothetical protein
MNELIKVFASGVAGAFFGEKLEKFVVDNLKPEGDFAKKAAHYGSAGAVAVGTFYILDSVLKVGK